MKIVLDKYNPNLTKIFDSEGKDITQELGLVEIRITASPDQLNTVELVCYADVEMEIHPGSQTHTLTTIKPSKTVSQLKPYSDGLYPSTMKPYTKNASINPCGEVMLSGPAATLDSFKVKP